MRIKYVPALAYPTPFERIFLMHDGVFIQNNIGFTYVLTMNKVVLICLNYLQSEIINDFHPLCSYTSMITMDQ